MPLEPQTLSPDAILLRGGTLRELSGRERLSLSSCACVWVVRSGWVDVFAVPTCHGEATGPRHHLCRVEPGGVLVGGRYAQQQSTCLRGIGGPGTEVLEIDGQELQAQVRDPATAAQLSSQLDRWFQRLLSGARSGQTATPTIWPPPGRDTSQVLAAEDLWPALDAAHREIVAEVDASSQALLDAELQRLEQKKAAEADALVRSLKQIATIAEPVGPGGAGLGTDDPLLAACQIIGQHMGVEVREPADYRQVAWPDPVGAIARSSGLHVRRVLLADQWWRDDNGPLLGFDSADNSPVALIPEPPTRTVQIRPLSGTKVKVDARVAAGLQPQAYCFYSGFPASALTARQVFRFGLPGTRADWLTIAGLGLAGALLGMLVPIATGLIFSHIIPGGQRDQLLLAVSVLAACAVVMALFDIVRGIAIHRVETRMGTRVEVGIWDRLLSLPASFFRNYAAGDLAMRAMGINAIRQVLTDAAMTGVVSFAFSMVSFGLLFYFDRLLAMIALLLFGLVLAVTTISAVRQLKLRRAYYAQRGQTAGIVLQLLSGISRLRVAGAENRALAYWSRFYSHQMRLSFRAQSVSNKLAAFLDALPVLGSLAVFAAVVWLSSSLSIGTFLAFNAAFAQILYSAVLLSSAVGSLIEVIPLFEQARPILSSIPEGRKSSRQPIALSGDIEINHVSFRYRPDSPLVLDDVTLHIRPGEFVALVGPSGAGKSTILRMLLGFEAPTSGSIYFDREDLMGLDLPAVRRQMGVVLQNSELTPGDILSNITRSFQYTQQQAWEAAMLTGLDQDIQEMPMGVYTVVSEGECTLSGGQRQRLLITRAIVSKPNILLFDEATSALDNISQAKVAESLERLKATRIVVAHRLSTIINADRICVIDRGKLVQEGTFRELIEQPGPFAELAKRQMLA